MSTTTRLALIFLAALPLAAQNRYQSPYLKAELFAGFSSALMEPGYANGDGLDRARLNGAAVSFTTYQFFRRWGLTAEFNTQARDRDGLDATAQRFLFGGTFRSVDRKRFAVTGRILAGVNRWSPTTGPAGIYREQNSFTFGLSPAIDIKLTENVAIRTQPGFEFVRRERLNSDRGFSLVTPLSVGVVFKFGNR